VEPLPELNKLIRDDVNTTVVPDETVQQLAARLSKSPTSWSEHCTRIRTIGSKDKMPQQPEKRIGLFVGISNYQHQNNENKNVGTVFPAGAPSARHLHDAFVKHCQLDEVKLLLNEQATKAALEEAILRWRRA